MCKNIKIFCSKILIFLKGGGKGGAPELLLWSTSVSLQFLLNSTRIRIADDIALSARALVNNNELLEQKKGKEKKKSSLTVHFQEM